MVNYHTETDDDERMTSIYLIRHAEAEGNLFRRAQGHWNGKITARGKLQIDALAERFKDTRLDAVYSSDLDRAVETAGALLRGRQLPFKRTPLLREINMGVWEGEPWGNVSYRWPEQMYLFNNEPERWHVPGSESFEAVQARMRDCMYELAAEHEGGVIAAVSHGMAIKIFLMGVFGIHSGDGRTMLHGDNTAVSLIEVDGHELRAVYYNDNSHLGEGLSTFAQQRWWRDTTKDDPTSLRFEPLDPRDKADADFYIRCYADSWAVAHGSTAGFTPSVYLTSAKAHSAKDKNCVMKVMSGETPAGILELDPRRGKDEGCGWVSLLYLRPEFRGKGFGVQLIGCAAAYFASKGRRAVRLHVAVTNTHAIDFYRHFGFTELGTEPGVASDQLLMERTN